MKEVKRLPRTAKFQYEDFDGTKVYTTKTRRYEVKKIHYGRDIIIKSLNKGEY